MAQNVIDVALVRPEDVKRKRFGAFLNKGYRFVKSLVSNNRHDGSENFGLHDFHIGCDVRKHGDWRVAIFDIADTADNLLCAFGNRILDEGGVAFGCAFIDNVDKVLTFMALGFGIAESSLDVFCKCFCKFLNFIFWAKGVVWRNAGLPSV